MDGPKNLGFYLEDMQDCYPPPPVRSIIDERREIQGYLEKLDNLNFFSELHTKHGPMSPKIRGVILLPARFEEHRIPNFFNAVNNELLNSNIELIILNNWRKGETPDNTFKLVEEYRCSLNCKSRILYFEHEWDERQQYNAMALARKLLADYALYRSAQRNQTNGPLYLFPEDADVEFVQPGRTQWMIDYLDENPYFDALRGIQIRAPQVLARNHLLLLERYSWYFTEVQLSQPKYWPVNFERANFYWHRVVTGGWNTCFSARIYAAINGYTPTVRIFEDMDIGQRISVLRGKGNDRRFIPDVSTIKRVPVRAISSANRAVLALGENRHIYDGSKDFNFFFGDKYEKVVRNYNIEDLLNTISKYKEISKSNLKHFELLCSELLKETLRIFENNWIESCKVFSRTMCLMGFNKNDFSITKGTEIRIKNYSQFVKNAQEYSKRYNPRC